MKIFLVFLISFSNIIFASNKFRKYFSFPSFEERIFYLRENYSDKVNIFSIGFSRDGRNIWCVDINYKNTNSKTLLLLSSSHPIEWQGFETPMRLAEKFSKMANDNQLKIRVFVIPVFNPDGFDYIRNVPNIYEIARKNRFYSSSITNTNYKIGVDLNRNFSYKWKKLIKDKTDLFYQGEEPFSEPETKELKNFVDVYKIDLLVSFHSFGKYVQYPYSYTKEAFKDEKLINVATKMAKIIGNNYRAIQDSYLSIKNGTEIDGFMEKEISQH